MPSMDAELTRESVLNQIGPGFSEADARAACWAFLTPHIGPYPAQT